MANIIYDSRIDWNSLKQRPQYIAEELAKTHDVIFSCIKLYHGEVQNSNDSERLIVKHFYHIPFFDRNRHLRKVNDYLRFRFYKNMVNRFNPCVIIVTDAYRTSLIRKCYNGPLVYDCMDDHVSFDPMKSEETKKVEEATIKESIFTIVSSNHLIETLVKRYGEEIRSKLVLVRNGCEYKWTNYSYTNQKKEKYVICYFGTIGTWFDTDILLKSLEDFDNIEYLIIGNMRSGVEIPPNPRIKCIGAIPHNQLEEATKECDAFIMPFKINDLVLSVDPVKLYEYISYGKNIICVDYPEIQRFSDYIFMYNNYDSYKYQIKEIITSHGIKGNEEERKAFLKNNTWQKRAEQIVDALGLYKVL